MSTAGTVVDLFLPNDRETGKPRGFAFVEFSSDEEASQAIAKFNGHELDGRPLRINEAEDRPRARTPRPPRSMPSFSDGPDDGFGGGGGGGGGGGPKAGKSKGSRRGLRGRKRML